MIVDGCDLDSSNLNDLKRNLKNNYSIRGKSL